MYVILDWLNYSNYVIWPLLLAPWYLHIIFITFTTDTFTCFKEMVYVSIT